MSQLAEITQALLALPEKERQELAREAMEATKDLLWVPNPGPQTDCYYCEADEILFGGEPGGGKSQVLISLALNEHERSLLLRRTNKEASKFVGEIEAILGSRASLGGRSGATPPGVSRRRLCARRQRGHRPRGSLGPAPTPAGRTGRRADAAGRRTEGGQCG